MLNLEERKFLGKWGYKFNLTKQRQKSTHKLIWITFVDTDYFAEEKSVKVGNHGWTGAMIMAEPVQM